MSHKISKNYANFVAIDMNFNRNIDNWIEFHMHEDVFHTLQFETAIDKIASP